MTITLHFDRLTVTADVSGENARILSVTDPEGNPVSTSPADLDAIEPALFRAVRSFEVAETQALDFLAGRMERFTVYHDRGTILEIRNTGGVRLASHDPQFTEAAEAFHLDREAALIEGGDLGYEKRFYC